MDAYKRYRKFGGKEQREEPRVREFREFGTASLRGITVLLNFPSLQQKNVYETNKLGNKF